jgi:membrane associated rhomboid family serine protease
MEADPQSDGTVYRTSDRRQCQEHALVLDAAGIRHRIAREAAEFTIVVAPEDAERALEELRTYARENRGAPPRQATLPHRPGGLDGVMYYVTLLLLVAVLADQRFGGLNWLAAGKTNAGLIRQGEWWRTVTALTLHADLSHLLANAVVGGLFGLFASQLLGSGLAWLSILIGGAAGNAINACVRPAEHTSIGASTAVFAALGIVAAYAWTRRRQLQASPLMRWAPLISAAVLLGYLGAGGARTDVAAHVFGFFAGLMLGALYGRLGDLAQFAPATQRRLGITALAVLVLAWTLALTTAGH